MTGSRQALPGLVREPVWWEPAGVVGRPTRPTLPDACTGGATLPSFDVLIVGAGYTGLWTAYHLAAGDPGLHIGVLEAGLVGHGASGRNGGWLSATVPGSRERLAAERGAGAVRAMARELTLAVDEVLAVASLEGIELDAVRSGCLRVATTPAQANRLATDVRDEARWDGGTGTWSLLSAREFDERLHVAGAQLGAFTPHCARIQPAKLVMGLAAAVERRGVRLFEQSPALEIGPGYVRTRQGIVRARHVLRATEGFTGSLPGQSRRWLPMNSSMIATEPLDPAAWAEIGWAAAETLRDGAHAYAYLQRTADGRIAIGGRGRPYVYGGRFDPAGGTPDATVRALRSVLVRLFPVTAQARVTHAWSGVLAVPRDWCAGVGHDQLTGLGWAGGYAGQGVTAAYLAGATLADLVLWRDTSRTALPWVGRVGRDWEPEPARWLGVHGIYAAYRAADRIESRRRSDRSALLARVAGRVSGRQR